VKLVFWKDKLFGRREGEIAPEEIEAILQDYSEKFTDRMMFNKRDPINSIMNTPPSSHTSLKEVKDVFC
jgi:hypothetical protein